MRKARGARRRGAAALLALLALPVALPAIGLAQSLEPPPPTLVPVPGGGTSPSPFPTALRTPGPSRQPPQIRAASAILADLGTGQALYESDPDQRRPIASVTKIMTALLVLERTDPANVVTVSPEAAAGRTGTGISQLGLVAGERITVEDLLYALILQSANDAAIALAEHVSGTVEAFVAGMNEHASRLGLRNTRFASPNGLDNTGFSSARDLVTMTRAAFAHPLFETIVATRFREIPSPSGPSRVIQNRNVLLWLYPGAIGGKTGFTTPAGFCLVAAAERDGVRLVAVVLGEPGEPFSDAAALLDHGFAAFELRELVREGRPFGAVPIAGREVQVVAGVSLSALVAVDAVVRRRVTLRPGVTFPPEAGETVGFVTVSTPDMSMGRVPLVVADVPGPPPAEPGPWWRRAGSAVLEAVSSVLSALLG
ncbi:MAG: D-alanyl-D-alanine carboxypeptidase family protein [Actinomycetota bacterium]